MYFALLILISVLLHPIFITHKHKIHKRKRNKNKLREEMQEEETLNSKEYSYFTTNTIGTIFSIPW